MGRSVLNFEEIFAEYYAAYRGQATNIPGEGDREWDIAVKLANNAIRKWDRVDGVQWRELWTTLQEEEAHTVSTSSTEYEIDNMRKPPAYITLRNGDTQSTRLQVIEPHEIKNYSSLNSFAYFTGSPNRGFVLHLDGSLDNYAGWAIDFPYLRKPNLITGPTSKPDMSDPNFMIQDMLASRFANARNGFGYKIAKGEANTALVNMKIENNTRTYGSPEPVNTSSWGTPNSNDLRI